MNVEGLQLHNGETFQGYDIFDLSFDNPYIIFFCTNSPILHVSAKYQVIGSNQGYLMHRPQGAFGEPAVSENKQIIYYLRRLKEPEVTYFGKQPKKKYTHKRQ